mmetsp:Transcript_137076/g.347251  ORF Transcript_137076/g.347251 Transcript_137076/m.347251 type:complete len:521 (+) Transcript_137076:195-1757(+)
MAPSAEAQNGKGNGKAASSAPLTKAAFCRGLREMGFSGDAELIYEGLDTSGQGRLWYDEFQYLFVLFRTWQEPLSLPRNLIPKLGGGKKQSEPKTQANRAANVLEKRTRAQDEVEGAKFARWALDHWKVVVETFMHETTPGGPRLLRVVKTMDFAHWIHVNGFVGDGLAVVRDIKHACRSQGFLWGMFAEEQSEKEELTISIAQVQCFRKCYGATVRRMLLNTMRDRRGFGSMLRCWRLDFDKDGDGKVSKQEFEHACHVLCCNEDFGVLWHTMRPDGSLDPLEIWDVAPAEAEDVEEFAALMLMDAKFDLSAAWGFLDHMRNGQAEFQQFKACCERLGFRGNIPRLFKGLDSIGSGVIYQDSLDPAWVLCFGNLLPTRRNTQRRSGTSPGQRRVELDISYMLVRLELDHPGSSSFRERDVIRQLRDLGYSITVARVACRMLRSVLKKNDLEQGYIKAKSNLKPRWDYSDVPRLPRSVPVWFSETNPAVGALFLSNMYNPPDSLIGGRHRPNLPEPVQYN